MSDLGHSDARTRATIALGLFPNKTNVTIAKELGISADTVRRARVEIKGETKRAKKTASKIAFELINADVEFRFLEVDKQLLSVPTELYQRDESGGKVAKEIAMHFDWVAFGVLIVVERADGSLHIVDGGTRWAASKLRTDITLLPCRICRLSDDEAAKTFLRINMNRRKLRTHQQQHAEVFAHEELALVAENIMTRFAQHHIGFDALTVLRSGLKSNHAATTTVARIVLNFASDKHLTARVFKALIWVEHELRKHQMTLESRANLRKLHANFGGLDAFIAGSIPQRATGDKKTCGLALARKCRIHIPKE